MSSKQTSAISAGKLSVQVSDRPTIFGNRKALTLACSSLLLASTTPAFANPFFEDPPTAGQCGSSWDAQHVEQYDGSMGVSKAFVKQHQGPVGYRPSGCSGTLITRDLFLSAGHCEFSSGDRVWFDHQINGDTGAERISHVYRVVEVLEQRNDNELDYALVRLADAPGERFGYTPVANRIPGWDEPLAVLGHPYQHNGSYKVLTTGAAMGAAPSARGDNWFGHTADASDVGWGPFGNFHGAGEGVLDRNGQLVGIHTDGECVATGENSALRMTAVLAHSKALSNLGRDSIWRFNSGYRSRFGDYNGSFNQAPQDVSGKYRPFSGDFNGDGMGDIFWYAPGQGSPDQIWWGNPWGDFDHEAKSVSGLYIPFAGDFDGDGDDDIFWYAPGPDKDYIWWANGGSFSSETWRVNGDYRPFVGDFDGDGDDDIFWYGWQEEPWEDRADFISWANGGSFAIESISVEGKYRPIVGDFDGDSDDDILWTGRGQTSEIWWSDAGAFSSETPSQKPAGAQEYYSSWYDTLGYTPFVGDFNADGYDDIFWYAPGENRVSVDGEDRLVSDEIWWSNGASFSRQEKRVDGQYLPLVGDFDGDQHDDIFWYGY
jgi:hypothetical protein